MIAFVGGLTITMWIGFAATGVAITVFNLYDAWEDLTYLRKRELSNGRYLIAKAGVATDVGRLIALLLLLVAGILVAKIQYNPDPPPASLYVRSVIILTIVTLVANSGVQRWLRLKVNRPPKVNRSGQVK